jgi:hypothetical protein
MWIDDLCSPVLVKEVRQALRGRSFAFGFTVALGLAGVLVAVALLEVGRGPGGRLVLPIFFVLAAALLVFVPFHSHQSMRQEDAEGARDFLALSPLGPWRIVLGKLAAAMVVAALILAAFLPFVVVIALQPAVDTAAVLMLLGQIAGMAVLLSALGVASGALRANRFGKGLGVVVLASSSLGILALEVRAAEAVLNGRARFDVLGLAAGGALLALAITPLLLGFAAAMLARADREVSRGLRIAWLVYASATALAVAVVMPRMGAPADAIVSGAVLAILAGTFVAAVLVTEDERLDPESARGLARTRFWPLRVTRGLFIVGGGRGIVLTLALGLLISVSALIGTASAFTASTSSRVAYSYRGPSSYSPSSTMEVLFRAALILVTAVGVSLAFASIPAYVLVHERAARGARKIARWTSAISLMTLSFFLPLVLVVTSLGSFDESALLFSPAFVMVDAAHDLERVGPPQGELFLWSCVGLVAVFFSLTRALRGLYEVRVLHRT